MKPIIFSL